MSRTTENLSIAVLGSGCAALVALAGLAFASADRAAVAAGRVEHSHRVRAEVSAVLTTLTDAEAAQRGYLLTDDPTHLEAYRAAIARLPDELARLAVRTADDPDRRRQLDDLRPPVAVRLAEFERTIRLCRDHGPGPALEVVRTGEGRRTMDALRRAIGEMRADEDRLLAGRQAAAAAAAGRVRGVVVGLMAGAVVQLLAGLVVIRRTLEARQLAVANLTEQAVRDELTGLFNRREVVRRLGELVRECQRSGRPAAVVLADIDHFKVINDTHGHAVGDDVLKVVAQRLTQATRGVDTVARYGGEEFCLLLPDLRKEDLFPVVDRVRAAVAGGPVAAAADDGADLAVRVTMSFGFACLSAGSDATPEELLRRADTALYEAKRQGRNRVVRGLTRILRRV